MRIRARVRVAARIVLALAAGSALSAFVAPSVAHAESDADRSRVHFNRGVELSRTGHDKEASDEFATAYKLYPHDSILLNLGITLSKTGEYVDAEQDLMRYLSDYAAATPEEQASARAALADVRGHIGTLRVHVVPAGASVKIDDRPVPIKSGETTDVRVVAGAHQIVAEAENFAPQKEKITVTTSRVDTVEIKLDPQLTLGPVTATSSDLPIALLLGVAVSGLAIGTYSGIHAIDLSSQYDQNPDPGLRHEGLTFRALTDVCFGVSIVAVGVGAWLYFGKRASAQVGMTPNGAALTF